MKKDYLSPYKQETMRRQVEEGKQYYPTDNQGVIDEWGAMAKHQDALWDAYKNQEKQRKKEQSRAYAAELDAQRSLRKTKAERDAIKRMQAEREQIQQANNF
jgi:hypothetical protein